eukprot:552128-Amorphochlora_amoeboformis.AAC.2
MRPTNPTSEIEKQLGDVTSSDSDNTIANPAQAPPPPSKGKPPPPENEGEDSKEESGSDAAMDRVANLDEKLSETEEAYREIEHQLEKSQSSKDEGHSERSDSKGPAKMIQLDEREA